MHKVCNISALKIVLVYAGEIELVIISESLTIDAGESALLVCVGFDTDNTSVDISWSRNGETIRNSSSFSVTMEDLLHSNQLFMQSLLRLCGAQHLESGNYSCSISNETSSVSSSVRVTINGKLIIEQELIIVSHDYLSVMQYLLTDYTKRKMIFVKIIPMTTLKHCYYTIVKFTNALQL